MPSIKQISAACLIWLAALAVAGPAGAQTSKQEKIRELLEISQTETLLNEVLPVLLHQQKAAISGLRPDIPEEAWDLALEEAEAAFRESIAAFLEKTIPIYDRHLTEEEVDGLLAFYRTPVGRSVIRKLPQVTQESMIAGQQWGLAVGEEVQRRIHERLKLEGYKI
ncbi:MAG: hypothetical protein Tsb0032_23580 [Kiloniellaceae bacterium]